MFSKQARDRRRMAALTDSIAAARQRLAVLEEQVQFLRGVEADAATDAAVRGGEAAGEHRVAQRDLARAIRERDEVAASLQRDREAQDQLLESWGGA